MREGKQGKITSLLENVRQGDSAAVAEILEIVYPELRRIAGHLMRKERSYHTLQATGLVHEAFLRLFNGGEIPIHCTQDFFAVSATHMRRVLTDHARRNLAAKRQPAEDFSPYGSSLSSEQLLDINCALDEMAEDDPVTAKIVELRFYVGLSIEETAAVLQISPRSAVRSWAWARAWLYRRLAGAETRPFAPLLVTGS